MSSSVCQVLPPCLEQRIAEPSVLRLKLSPPGSSSAAGTAVRGNDTGGWSFLQCLDAVSSGKDEVYVHPQAKSSASKLSAASLAMCTESLGSETGSESGDDISLLSLDNAAADCRRRMGGSPAGRDSMMSKKRGRGDLAFPPPLTSISGSGGVRVRPRREDGRLIMTAVSVSPTSTNLLAERSGGRLRIRLLTESSGDSASEQETEEADHEHETEYIDDGEEEYEDYKGGHFGERCGNVGGKIGIESLITARMSTCKVGGHGNENWESHFGWPLKPICLS